MECRLQSCDYSKVVLSGPKLCCVAAIRQISNSSLNIKSDSPTEACLEKRTACLGRIEKHRILLHTRPPDERFAELESLRAYTSRLKASAHERVTEFGDLHIDVTDRLGLALNGIEEPALLTNWTFNQLFTAVGASDRVARRQNDMKRNPLSTFVPLTGSSHQQTSD